MAGSMIGEIDALGGGLVPNAMGHSGQHASTCVLGLFFFAALSLCMLMMLKVMQIR